MAAKKRLNNNYSVMVYLDALMDTRLGALSTVSEEAVKDLLAKNRWKTRVDDNYSKLVKANVDMDKFDEVYASRDKDILSLSAMTSMENYLRVVFMETLAYKISVGNSDVPVMHINTYPYNISAAGKEHIRKYYVGAMAERVDVNMVFIPPHVMTPTALKGNYTMIISYDIESWLEWNGKLLEETPIPDVDWVLPEIGRDLEEREKKIKEENNVPSAFKDIRAYDALKEMLRYFLFIRLISVEYYSLL